jgi:uncharacterized protein YndB with AHSA1/START domain
MPNNQDKFGGISSDAVSAKTGKGWNEWLEILDAEQAQTLPHKQIAQLLYDKYNVPAWWCQMVTVGYEQARGLRAVHQKADGFSASASKTLNAPLSALYQACADEATRAKWMGRKRHTVNKATPNKSLRLVWGKDGANRVDFNLYAKGASKSQIAIEHTKLADATEAETMKTYWRGSLDKLAKLIEK